MNRLWSRSALSLLVALAACGQHAEVAKTTSTASSALAASGDAPGDVGLSADETAAGAHLAPIEPATIVPNRGEIDLDVPLPALPSRAGFGPAHALRYASTPRDTADGFGVGFQLDVPSITMTSDWGVPLRGLVDEATGDFTARMALGSARLVWVKREQVGGVWRIEYRLDAADSLVRIFRYPDGGTVDVRDGASLRSLAFKGFQVVYPDGRQEIYSEDPHVAEGATLSATVFFATRWPLQYAIGPTRELVTYQYEQGADARSYLRSITFAGGRSKYVLESAPRTDPSVTYAMGFPQGTRVLYTKLTATFDDVPMHQWCFVYGSRAGSAARIVTHPDCQALADLDFAAERTRLDASLGRQDKLVGIYRFGKTRAPFDRATPAEPLLRYRYTDWTENDLVSHPLVYDYPVADVAGFGPAGGSELLDVDNDGLDDILRYSAADGQSYPSYNQGDLTAPSAFVRGAGIVLERNDNGTVIREAPHFDETTASQGVFLLGDFDGDGRRDVVKALRGASATRLFFFRGQPQADKPFATASRESQVPADLARLMLGHAQVVDVNGDGKDDIVFAVPIGTTSITWTALVNVTLPGEDALSFQPLTGIKVPFTGGTELDNPAYRFLDANGDGLTDFAVLKVSGAGDKGLCVYENQGWVTAYPLTRRAKIKGALLVGAADVNDAVCGNGYFLPIAGLSSSQSLNGFWLIDVDRDGFVDLVDIASTSTELQVWLGHGRDGFSPPRTLPLNLGVSVDPKNKWNTRVLDTDGDGSEEIFVYEPSSTGGRIKLIDFNRQGIKNTIAPSLLVEASEGTALRQAFQYATTTDERIRDLRNRVAGAPAPRGLPFATTVVKRHFLSVGGGAPRVREYAYHAPAFDGTTRELVGFGDVTEMDFGDESEETLAVRRTYTVAGTGAYADRLLADRLHTEERFAPRLTVAQKRRADATASSWVDGIDQASQTSETWSEEPLVARVTLAVREEQWSLAPASPTWSTPAFARLALEREQECSGDEAIGCTTAAVMTRTRSYDDLNRIEREQQDDATVAGPQGTSIPAESIEQRFTYDETWQAQGVVGAIRQTTSRALPSGRVLAEHVVGYATNLPLPTSTAETVAIDDAEIARLPAGAQSALATKTTRTQSFAYDAYGNATELRDAVGLVQRTTYDPSGVRIVRVENALGHATAYCYGTSGCTIDAAAITPLAPLPAVSLEATHAQGPRGDVTIAEADDLHRPVRIAASTGTDERYAYRPADASAPQLVAIAERRWSDADAATRGLPAFLTRVAAFRADGLPIGSLADDEAGRSRVQSYALYNRRGDRSLGAEPYRTDGSAAALFAEGRFPAPAGAAECGHGTYACTTYDAEGRPVRTLDAAGRLTTQIAHEPWGERTAQSSADAPAVTRSEVARDGETYAVVDEDGNAHHFDRDERGHLRRTWVAGETSPRVTVYDSSGDLVLSAVPGGLTRIWSRDARGRATDEWTWGAGFAAWERVSRGYDALDRVIAVSTSSAARTTWDDIAFVYDRRPGDPKDTARTGLLLESTARDAAAGMTVTERYAYDGEGRVVSRAIAYDTGASPKGYEERWGYAFDDTLVSRVDPFGNAWALTPEASGAPSSIAWTAPGGAPAALLGGMRYDARGNLEAYDVAGVGLHRGLEHEAASGLLTHARACASGTGGACKQDHTYTRRADGRVSGVQAPGASGPIDVATYAYGLRGELASAHHGDRSASYEYSGAGGVRTLDDGAPRAFHAPDGTSLLPLPDGEGYALDSFGRVVTGGSLRAAEYDPFGRIRRAEVGGKTILYTYSASGHRAAKTSFDTKDGVEGARDVVYYPNAGTRDDGRQRQSVVEMDDHRAALILDEARVLALVDDERGATTAAIDVSGDAVATIAYDPYGAPIDTQLGSVLTSTELVFGFTGQLTDPDTGFVHMGAREYAPSLASFGTPDPYALAEPELCAESPLECHFYAYAGHDPVNADDPEGQSLTSVAARAASATRSTVRGTRNVATHAARTLRTRGATHVLRGAHISVRQRLGGKLNVSRVTSHPKSLWGKSAEEITDAFKGAGYGATPRQSTRGSARAELIAIAQHSEISQIQVHPGGGRHGGAYVKISTSTKGIIKVVDGRTYRPTPSEKATIVYARGGLYVQWKK